MQNIQSKCRLISAVIFAALLCAIVGLTADARAEPASLQPRQIFVGGSAEVLVVPDRVRLVFGVSERSMDIKAASGNIDTTLGKALSMLRTKGVQDKYVQTSHVSIRPEYNFERGQATLLHYVLSQSFSVILEEPALYREVFSELIALGINEVHDVSFIISEPQKYKDEALVAAFKAAGEKAELLASAGGLKLGNVISIQEGRQEQIMPRMRGVMPNAALAMDAAGGLESFAVGTIPVRAEVAVVFEFEIQD